MKSDEINYADVSVVDILLYDRMRVNKILIIKDRIKPTLLPFLSLLKTLSVASFIQCDWSLFIYHYQVHIIFDYDSNFELALLFISLQIKELGLMLRATS